MRLICYPGASNRIATFRQNIMENILLPTKFEITAGENPNEAKLVLEPCYYGYGTTVGNALRRVLLSSLPGAAVTAVKIKGAQHEFSSVTDIKEDVLEIILNLKLLRMRLFSEEPVKLSLKVKGEKEITAADFEKNSDVEIVNPDLKIATLTNKKGEFEMEITIEKGRGYVPTESRNVRAAEIGTIMIDALFSPIRTVGYKVENARVGDITNYDRLIMNIETDGTINPEDAVKEASKVIISYFQLLIGEQNQYGVEMGVREEDPLARMQETVTATDLSLDAEPTEVPFEAPAEELTSEEDSADAEDKPKRKRGRPKKSESGE